MNLKRYILLFLIAAALLLVNLQFTYKQDTTEESFRRIISDRIFLFGSAIDSLESVALGYKENKKDLGQLRLQLKSTRLAYKKLEYILEYYYPKHIKSYINGPPLDHLNQYPIDTSTKASNYYGVSPEEYSKTLPLDNLNTDHYRGKPQIIPPAGLQALDELVFSDEAAAGKDQILQLANDLKVKYAVLLVANKKLLFFKDFEIIESARIELVRIFSMGITGFDTPGSLNGLSESASALEGLQEILHPLLLKLEVGRRANTEGLLLGAIQYLKRHDNFDTFDRLTFLTDYINPLYKELLQVQLALHLKSSAEVYQKVPSWNAYSTNIFAQDFLNPYYYSLLKKKDDSEQLRLLGKQLFYDTRLSGGGKISCASCHKPELAFSDGIKTSLASVEGKNVLRNSPSLINAVFSDKYFYDLRAFDLEEQAGHVIENHLEFDTSFPELVKKLNGDSKYVSLFTALFGKEKGITRYQFSAALSSYVISLRSFDSPFDRYVQGKTKQLPADVKLGFNLFMGKANCATCHYAPLFSGLVPPLYNDSESEVLGVLKGPNVLEVDNDPGRIGNGVIEDNEKIYRNSFKTMTVRNTALTAPYFHNGAYKTLDEVIDFYNKGGAAGMGLSYDIPNQTLSADPLHLNKREVKALIAYIKSLNDTGSFVK